MFQIFVKLMFDNQWIHTSADFSCLGNVGRCKSENIRRSWKRRSLAWRSLARRQRFWTSYNSGAAWHSVRSRGLGVAAVTVVRAIHVDSFFVYVYIYYLVYVLFVNSHVCRRNLHIHVIYVTCNVRVSYMYYT